MRVRLHARTQTHTHTHTHTRTLSFSHSFSPILGKWYVRLRAESLNVSRQRWKRGSVLRSAIVARQWTFKRQVQKQLWCKLHSSDQHPKGTETPMSVPQLMIRVESPRVLYSLRRFCSQAGVRLEADEFRKCYVNRFSLVWMCIVYCLKSIRIRMCSFEKLQSKHFLMKVWCSGPQQKTGGKAELDRSK